MTLINMNSIIKNSLAVAGLVLLSLSTSYAQSQDILFEISLDRLRSIAPCSQGGYGFLNSDQFQDQILCELQVRSENERRQPNSIRITANYVDGDSELLIRQLNLFDSGESIREFNSTLISDALLGDLLEEIRRLGASEETVTNIQRYSINPVQFDDIQVTATDQLVLKYKHLNSELDTLLQELIVELSTDIDSEYSEQKDQILENLIEQSLVLELDRKGYNFDLINAQISYRNAYGQPDQLLVPGERIYTELNEQELWETYFENPDSVQMTILSADKIERINGASLDRETDLKTRFDNNFTIGFDELSVSTPIFGQKFNIGMQLGRTDRNEPFIWHGGFHFKVDWYPSPTFPLFKNFDRIGVKFKKYDNFTYGLVGSSINSWESGFLNGSIFKLEKDATLPRNLVVDQFEMQFLSMNLLELGGGSATNALHASYSFQIPSSSFETYMAEDGSIAYPGFVEVDNGPYAVTKSSNRLGFDFYNGNLSPNRIYLKSIGLHYMWQERYLENSYIDKGVLYLSETTDVNAIIPSVRLAYLGPKEDLVMVELQSMFGDLQASNRVSVEVKATDNLYLKAHYTQHSDFQYESTFMIGPVFKFDLRGKASLIADRKLFEL